VHGFTGLGPKKIKYNANEYDFNYITSFSLAEEKIIEIHDYIDGTHNG